MATVYIEREPGDHLRLKNVSGSAIAQGQLVVIAGFVGVADEAVANGSVGSFHVEEGLVIQASNLTSGASTFATEGQAVYLDASGDFSDVPAAGYYQVGNLISDKDSDGVIRFAKLGRAVSANGLFTIAGTPTNNDTLKFVTSTGLWTTVAVAD